MLSEKDFVNMELEKAGGVYLPKETMEYILGQARIKYQRMRVQHEEHLDVKQYYDQWANNSLKVIKKTPGPRAVLTVTIPKRMLDRLNGLPRGNKSAYVTRLLARGWLSQMGDSE